MSSTRGGTKRDAAPAGSPVGLSLPAGLRLPLQGGLFLVLLVPFVVTPSLAFPFVTGKALVLRTLVSLLFIPWVLLLARDPASRPRKSPVLIALTVFSLTVAATALFGSNPYRSFWSTFERMEGVIFHLHMLVFFLMLATVFRDTRDWFRFLNTAFVVSVAMAGLALLQWSGLLPIAETGVRVSGRLGNGVFLAAYLQFHILLGVFLLLRSRRGVVTSRLFAGAVVVECWALYLTGTRGAFVGLMVGVLCALVLMALATRGRARRAAIFASAMLVFGLGLVYLGRDSPTLRPFAPTSRIFDLSAEDHSSAARILIWGVAASAFRERPWLGWGIENFNLALDRHFAPALWEHERWFDRAHNVLLDWLVGAGLVGGVTYLGIFACALWILWKSQTLPIAGRAAGAGLIVACFVTGLVSFDSLSSHLMFVILLAYLHHVWEIEQPRGPEVGGPVSAKTQTIATLAAGLMVIASMPACSINPWHAAKALAQTGARLESEPLTSLAGFSLAIDLGTNGSLEASTQLLQAAIQLHAPGSTQPRKVKDAFLEKAAREMALRAAEEPTNARPMLLLGMMLVRLGHPDQGMHWLERAHRLAPRRQSIAQELGNAYLVSGHRRQAFDLLRDSYDLYPANTEAQTALIVAAIYAGRKAALPPGVFEDWVLADPLIVNAAVAAGDEELLRRIRAFLRSGVDLFVSADTSPSLGPGWWGKETWPDGRMGRWTHKTATLILDRSPQESVLVLDLSPLSPTNRTVVNVAVNGVTVARFVSGNRRSVKAIDVRPLAVTPAEITLTVDETFRPRPVADALMDERDLGVFVHSVRFARRSGPVPAVDQPR